MSDLNRVKYYKPQKKLIPLGNGWGLKTKNRFSSVPLYQVYDRNQYQPYPAFSSSDFDQVVGFSKQYISPEDFYAFESFMGCIEINPFVRFELVKPYYEGEWSIHPKYNSYVFPWFKLSRGLNSFEVEADRLLEKGVEGAEDIHEIIALQLNSK